MEKKELQAVLAPFLGDRAQDRLLPSLELVLTKLRALMEEKYRISTALGLTEAEPSHQDLINSIQNAREARVKAVGQVERLTDVSFWM